MASDMSGYQGAGGKQRWMQESGGDEAAYNREMGGWQKSQAPAAPAAPANYSGGTTGRGANPWAGVPQAPAPASGGPNLQQTKDRAKQLGFSEDFERFKEDDIKRWNQYYDQASGKFRSSRGAEGLFEKPTECPNGMVPSGPDETDPCIPMNGGGGGGGQGGGGGAGGGGGYGGGTAWDNPIYQYLGSTGLQAAQDPEQALKNYMGWGGAGQYQQQMDQARQQVMAMPPGPARDAAAARLEEQKITQLGAMRQAATGQARGELTGLVNPEMGYNQMGLQESQFGRSLAEQARQANMQNALGWGGLSLQGELGRGQLGLGWAGQGLAQQQFLDQTGAGRVWQGQQAQLDRDLQARLNQSQINANKKSTFDKILGGVGAVAGILSDIRVKENIEELPALSRLKAIPVYSYNYTFEPERRRVGVMAQDVERVAPELVEEGADGLKRVDSYGLLALTINAVKELDDASN